MDLVRRTAHTVWEFNAIRNYALGGRVSDHFRPTVL